MLSGATRQFSQPSSQLANWVAKQPNFQVLFRTMLTCVRNCVNPNCDEEFRSNYLHAILRQPLTHPASLPVHYPAKIQVSFREFLNTCVKHCKKPNWSGQFCPNYVYIIQPASQPASQAASQPTS